VAKAQKIKLQHEASSNNTGTDTDVIFWTRGGIPSALISLPNRYMHSPVEVVSLKGPRTNPATDGRLRPLAQERARNSR
jgi:putative aminopeptidase FrvX